LSSIAKGKRRGETTMTLSMEKGVAGRVVSLAFCFVVVNFLAACATGGYQFSGVTYQSPEAALNAVRSHSAAAVAEVQKSSNPFGGRAKVVLPDRKRIEQSGVIRQQNTPQKHVSYIVVY
jgi:hypothetical protein